MIEFSNSWVIQVLAMALALIACALNVLIWRMNRKTRHLVKSMRDRA